MRRYPLHVIPAGNKLQKNRQGPLVMQNRPVPLKIARPQQTGVDERAACKFAAVAVYPGSKQKRLYYPATISKTMDGWPVLYRSEDILIKENPCWNNHPR